MKAITVKYNNGTYRYTATDNDISRPTRVIVPKDDQLDTEQNYDAAAIALCRKMRWDGPLMRGQLGAAARIYVFDAHTNRVRFESDFQAPDRAAHIERLRAEQLANYRKNDAINDPHTGGN